MLRDHGQALARASALLLGALLLARVDVTAVAAQNGPLVEVEPASAAPGETVTLRGSGWPAGETLVARLYPREASPSGPGADLAAALSADEEGQFEVEGTVPATLFGAGSRGNLAVVPGQYTIVVRAGADLSASTEFQVGAPREGALLWGQASFDRNENGQADDGDAAAAGIGLAIVGPGDNGPTRQAITDALGRYALVVPGGSYRVRGQAQFQERAWSADATTEAEEQEVVRADLLLRPAAITPPAVPHDQRYFFETRYRVDNDAVWSYFNARGGVDIFGYPVSRTFTFLGCPVQVFQRQIIQVCPGRGPALMNLLDPEIFPYTRVNFSTFPGPDQALKDATPKVAEPNYPERILDFVRATAPDVWEGQPVRFQSTFSGLITPEMAGTSDPGLLGLINLEAWGAPISHPMRDPNNANFVYQRFQRGIMHFDAATGVTRGILLADYLKQILRNSAELPPDLREQARDSRYFAQYCPGAPGWLCRPEELPGSDLTFAFEEG